MSKSEQVYETVVQGILKGEWKPGDKLPSVRCMGSRLGVHRLTVLKAYQRLQEDKWIEVRTKSGFYVCEKSKETKKPDIESSIYKDDSILYQMSRALIAPDLLPNRHLSSDVKQLLDLEPRLLGTYSSTAGDLQLRESLADYLLKTSGFSVSADELLITSGAQQAIDLAARAFVKPGDHVLIERPTYGPAIDAFQEQNATLHPVDFTENGYDMNQVEHLMRTHQPVLFYINPTFHNPTGFTLSACQRKELVELAEQYMCLLLEDDVCHDIYFDAPPPPPCFFYDTEGVVVYIRSFSKYISPGLRISVMMARGDRIAKVLRIKVMTDNGSPLFNQVVFRHIFFTDRMQGHIAKLRLAMQLRKACMEQQLEGSGLTWISPKGGLNLWAKLPSGWDADMLIRHSLKASVSFLPGAICDPWDSSTPYIRLSYSYLNEKQLAEGMKLLLQAGKMLQS